MQREIISSTRQRHGGNLATSCSEKYMDFMIRCEHSHRYNAIRMDCHIVSNQENVSMDTFASTGVLEMARELV